MATKNEILKILIIFFSLLIFITFSGCTSQDMFIRDPGTMNLSDEEQQEKNRDHFDESEERMWNNSDERTAFNAEQLEACDGKKQGDICEFTTLRGKLTGKCNIQEDQLKCLPESVHEDLPEDDR
jgi:hypothetical protein